MVVRSSMAWPFLLLLASLLAPRMDALELAYVLPDPLPVGMEATGQLRLTGEHVDQISDLKLLPTEGLELRLLHHRTGRFVTAAGTAGVIMEVDVIARLEGNWALPQVEIQRQGQRQQLDSGQFLEVQGRQGFLGHEASAQVRFQPDHILPGQATEMLLRVFAPERSGWEVDSDWQPRLGSWARSLGSTSRQRGYALDAQGRLWEVTSLRMGLTSAVSGGQVYGAPVPLQRRNRQGPVQERRLNLAPATLLVHDISHLGLASGVSPIIGPLAMSAELDRERIRVGEGARLRLRIRGPQLDQLPAPQIPAIPGLRIYPVPQRGGSERGQRDWDFQVIPETAGDYTIPAFELSWLDPQTRSYRQSTSEALNLEVFGAPEAPGQIAQAPAAPVLPARTALADEPQAPLVPLWREVSARLPLGWLWWGFVLALVCGALLPWAWRLRHWRPQPHRGRQLARALASGDLAQANRLADALIGPALPLPQRQRALQALRALEAARFGDQPLSAEERAILMELQEYP
ncbi:MAG: hypothetical protein EA402_06955 [Planctomycetota bacterium]|nr:MAG: hypothetical protein EA402_06955 [Planctomycetota bacterium]